MRVKRKRITIGIFGYGNMGRAIVTQLRTVPALRSVVTIMIHSLGVHRVHGVRCVPSVDDLLTGSDIIFLCIKPHDFYKLAPFNRADSEHLIVVSIMAGVRIESVRNIFSGAKVVRTMPNLPVQIGEGVIGWYCQKAELSSKEHSLLEKLFSVFGVSVALKDEKMFDALTAVAGSGPAYVFLFANALVRAAESLGFDGETARRIVSETIQGSLAYANATAQKEIDFTNLIQKVQSKGGTTEAALQALNVERFYEQFKQAIAEANRRSEKMSSYESK